METSNHAGINSSIWLFTQHTTRPETILTIRPTLLRRTVLTPPRRRLMELHRLLPSVRRQFPTAVRELDPLYYYRCCFVCCIVTRTSAVLRLECSLVCISGSVGHQQNIFRSFSHCQRFFWKKKKCNYKKCNWVSGYETYELRVHVSRWYNRRTASQPSHVVRQNLQKRKLRVLNPARIHVFYWFNWLNLIGS